MKTNKTADERMWHNLRMEYKKVAQKKRKEVEENFKAEQTKKKLADDAFWSKDYNIFNEFNNK